MKRVARQLLERYPDRFSTDFEQNAKVLAELVEIESKPLKSKIAGYITSLAKQVREG